MDDSAVAALCAVPPALQGSDAEKFFDLIIEMYGNGQTSLADLIPEAEQRDPGLVNPATEFSENLRMQGLDTRWPDIAQMLVSEGGSSSGLVALRDQCAAQAAAGEADGGAAPDWGSFCAQNADFWAGWNGTEWGQWRAAFAALVPGDLAGEGERHLSYLDSLPPASQLAYLRDNLGFAINQEAVDYWQSTEAGAEVVDPAQAWVDFCAQNVDFWAGWNGTEWGQWRAAFAGLVPGDLAAESERHLGVLDGLSPAGQLTYLRGNLGFTINEQALAYHQSTEAAAAAEAGPEPSDQGTPPQEPEALEPELVEQAEKAADDLVAELAAAPEIEEIMAEMSPEELETLFTDALGSV
jgi:hypothetical protein